MRSPRRKGVGGIGKRVGPRDIVPGFLISDKGARTGHERSKEVL